MPGNLPPPGGAPAVGAVQTVTGQSAAVQSTVGQATSTSNGESSV